MVLLAGLATGCGGGDDAEPTGSSSSPAAPQVAAGDFASAIDDLEVATQAGDDFLAAFATYDQALRELVQQDPQTYDPQPAQAASVPYGAAFTAYREAADSLSADPFVVDPAVAAALATYQDQVEATIDSREAGVAVTYSYALCDLTLELNLRDRARHTQAADLCIETVEPLTTSAYPEVAAYGTAMTAMMEERKRTYASVGRALGDFVPPDPDALDPDQLGSAGGALGQYADVVVAAGDRLTAAFDTFEPTLVALLGDGGSGGALQALYDASSVDASQAALLEALQAGAQEG